MVRLALLEGPILPWRTPPLIVPINDTNPGAVPMPRVLVADDQKDVRAMVGIVLRVNHYEVVEAESGAAGLKAFGESAFDAAIVDIFLTDASGIEVMAAIREQSPNLPNETNTDKTTQEIMGE